MIVDNFDKLLPLCRFDKDKQNIIMVWLVQRNKDGHSVNGKNKNRTIKSYHFQSAEQFEHSREEIMSLCNEFHCRAYVSLNPKPIINVLFTLQGLCIERIRQTMATKQGISLKGMLDSAVMKTGGDGDKWWVVDVDTTSDNEVYKHRQLIENARSGHEYNIIATIPTLHGSHFITYPFDVRVLEGTGIEVKKNCLTLLYANIMM